MRRKLLTAVHQRQMVKCSSHALEYSHSMNIFSTIKSQIDLSEKDNDVLFGQIVLHCSISLFLNIFLYSGRAIKHAREIVIFLSINNARLTDSNIYQYRQCVCLCVCVFFSGFFVCEQSIILQHYSLLLFTQKSP